ncbi:DUF2637 domain-containing protein [Kitasatospora sp. NPDC008050]|uniref:DUF2637 domain-containing protein n=1 Tax=Kitasatospora sp. NPDC008050 TaxID=3364021 RepID=UPI0036EC1564
MARPSLTRAHRVLLGLVAVGACLISGIGFAGSYSAVRELALHKGFGNFAYAFPIGVDAGIVVLLALDLVLTWLRIPFPLLRQAAWLLTVATIAFNAAASWGDPLGMGMHAVIPVLFVVVVEASRHAVGRIAAISADRHMESVRLMRWVLSPVPTFRLWRRMKLWELRSYDEVVRLEQNRLVYRAQLRFRYGRGWRRSAPIQALLPLKLAKYGVPLDVSLLDRIDPPVVPAVAAAAEPAAARAVEQTTAEAPTVSAAVAVPTLAKLAAARWRDGQNPQEPQEPTTPSEGTGAPVRTARPVTALRDIRAVAEQQEPAPQPVAETMPNVARPAGQLSPWFKAPAGAPRLPQSNLPQQQPQQQSQRPPRQRPQEPQAQQMPPQQRQPQPQQTQHQQTQPEPQAAPAPVQQRVEVRADGHPEPTHADRTAAEATEAQQLLVAEAPVEEFPVPVAPAPEPAMDVFAPKNRAQNRPEAPVPALAEAESALQGPQLTVDLAVEALVAYQDAFGHEPDEGRLADFLFTQYGVSGKRPGAPVSQGEIRRILPELRDRYATLGRE